MQAPFADRLLDLIAQPRPLSADERATLRLAVHDTMAVAFAGWHEPVTRLVADLYRGSGPLLLDGSRASSVEHAALVHAVAGHALDYDDVHLASVTHPSVVVVPALLAVASSRRCGEKEVLRAYAVGLAVTVALGNALGPNHYAGGWHATSVIGAVSSAAALCHLLRLDRAKTRSALALAAAQAGGMQRNFGTMAKPVQAGLAAAAGVRAAAMAELGVTGDADCFGPNGFLDLYADHRPAGAAAVEIGIDTDVLSCKLYPCCYATHRLIAAALTARRQLPNGDLPGSARIRLSVPGGLLRPLRVIDPHTGLEGKFCAAYTVAVALAGGAVTLADFTDEAVHRPDIRALMGRIEVTEEPADDPLPTGIDYGTVRLTIEDAGGVAVAANVTAYPGSPQQPATKGELQAKVADCLAFYHRNGGPAVTPAEFTTAVMARLGLGNEHPADADRLVAL